MSGRLKDITKVRVKITMPNRKRKCQMGWNQAENEYKET
jgi:hypothetical protein